MPPATKTIQGKVLLPNGDPAPGGDIRTLLVNPGHVDDGGVEQVISGFQQSPIAEADGAVNFKLVPNDLITIPNGGVSIYRVRFRTLDAPGGERIEWTMFWNIKSSDPDPLDIGDAEVLATIGQTPIPLLGQIGDVQLTNPQQDEVIIYNTGSGLWTNAAQSGAGGGGSLTSLSDTEIAGLADLDTLFYDLAAARWKNRPSVKLKEYTLASRPAASADWKNVVIAVREPGQGTRLEVCLETSVGGEYFWESFISARR